MSSVTKSATQWQRARLAWVLASLGALLFNVLPLQVQAADTKAPLKLLRYGPVGKEKPGLLDQNGVIRDLSRVIPDITPAQLSAESMAKLAALNPNSLPKVAPEQRIGMPIKGIGKIVGVGLNYVEHAREAVVGPGGGAPPPEPILFLKSTTSLSGPNDDVIRPKGSTALDHEVELVIVIGKTARNVAEKDAGSYIAGYALGNDVSERDFQAKRQGQWTKGKSADTFSPLGPYLVAAANVDQNNLGVWLKVNDQERQRASTADMIFKPHFLVAYISQFMTLEPGDVIYTGTPSGVGAARKPPAYLQPGDIITLGIDGLGEERQKVVAYEDGVYASVEDKIMATEMRRCAALASGDSEALAATLADDYVHVHSVAKVEGKSEFISGVKGKPRRVERGPLEIRVYGDAAVITGEMTNYFINADKTEAAPAKYFVTQVAHLQQGKWVIASMQVTNLANPNR